MFFFFSLAAKGASLWLDTSSVNAAIVNAYKSACDRYPRIPETKQKTKTFDGSNDHLNGPTAVRKFSPVSLAKAIKNESELEGMRNCHLRLPYFTVALMNVGVSAC